MDENTQGRDEAQIYEVGYHILPTIAEESLPQEVSRIQSLISESGGTIIAEEFPQMRPLAYEIAKQTETKYSHYTKAFFGWIKFELNREDIGSIQTGMDANQNILRYILIKTVRENTITTPKVIREKKDEKDEVSTSKEEKPELSEEEIDKSIDDLVIN